MPATPTATRPKSFSAQPTHTPVSPVQRRSKIGIVVRLFCAAVALLMVLTVDATPQNYKYYKPKPIYEGAPSYEQDRYPDNSKHKTYGNYGYQDNSYGNQERYAPRTSYPAPFWKIASRPSRPHQHFGLPHYRPRHNNVYSYYPKVKPSGNYKEQPTPYLSHSHQKGTDHYADGSEDDICPAIPVCDSASHHYRTEDGSCNNLEFPYWGQAGLPYVRKLDRQDNLVDCGRAAHLPNPRLVSSALIRRKDNEYYKHASIMVMIYGQAIDHDMMKTPENTEVGECCPLENRDAPSCCPIIAPHSDHHFGRNGHKSCIEFLRSVRVKGIDCEAKSDVQNENTAFIDASFLYGSDKQSADLLRTFEGGALRSFHDTRHRMYPPTPLDLNNTKTVPVSGCCDMGDRRGDNHSAFLLILTVFLRLHNRIAESLSHMHPDWNDEWVFQETKKIVIAIHQNIVYGEWLDHLLGSNDLHVHTFQDGYEDVYDPKVDPTISMVFSTSAYRLHTLIPGYYVLRDAHYDEIDRMKLRHSFRNPKALTDHDNFDNLIRGLATQPVHDFDNVFSAEMTEWLFPRNDSETGVSTGIDIVSANVQRGRDHQLPTYPSYRALCGHKKPKTWKDMTRIISPEHVRRLSNIYRSPADVDLYIAQIMERPLRGSLLGPTSHCIVEEQFERLKTGDRFFYTNPDMFTPSQLSAVKKVTLSRVLCDHADNPSDMKLPRDMFRILTSWKKGDNPLLSCRDTVNIPALDLEPWS